MTTILPSAATQLSSPPVERPYATARAIEVELRAVRLRQLADAIPTMDADAIMEALRPFSVTHSSEDHWTYSVRLSGSPMPGRVGFGATWREALANALRNLAAAMDVEAGRLRGYAERFEREDAE